MNMLPKNQQLGMQSANSKVSIGSKFQENDNYVFGEFVLKRQ